MTGIAATEPEIDSAEASGTYRPHLDGLRAVAVYLVVAFHSSVDRAVGGFIGVDVFFVLSGYLVTQLLMRDLQPSGSLRFARFYSRRVRRLLPAAAVNLVVTAVVFAVVAAPVELQTAQDALRAAALYVSNWFLIAESADYFGTEIDSIPVAHYWSLSVEEQFYIVWPLLLAGLYRVATRARRHRKRIMQVVVIGAGALSLAEALWIATTDLNRAYYGTDTRAYQLLAGAALAITPGVIGRARHLVSSRFLAAASVVLAAFVVVLGSTIVGVGPITRGALVTVTTCALIVSLEAASGGVARRFLSWGPVVYLGRISYGTYLWHWLVVIVIVRNVELSGLGTFAVAAAVATGLASISYQLIEHPIRISPALDRRRKAVVAVGLAMSVLVGVVVVPWIFDDEGTGASQAVSEVRGGTPVNADTFAALGDFYNFSDCPPGRGQTCEVVQGNGKRVLLLGESHAGMYTPLFKDLARQNDLSLSVGFLDFCPWTRGIRYLAAGRNCFEEQDTMFDESIPDLDPDVVVLVHRAVGDPRNRVFLADEDEGVVDGRDEAPALRRRVQRVVRDLRDDGRRVVLMEPVPVSPLDEDPVECLSEADFVEECRFVVPPEPLAEERIFRDLARSDEGVWSLDLDLLACPYLPICDPVVKGMVVRRDDNHLTTAFARTFREPVEKFLVDNEIIS